jgi:hypothetical protein
LFQWIQRNRSAGPCNHLSPLLRTLDVAAARWPDGNTPSRVGWYALRYKNDGFYFGWLDLLQLLLITLKLQRYYWFTHFKFHRCTPTNSQSSLVVVLQRISTQNPAQSHWVTHSKYYTSIKFSNHTQSLHLTNYPWLSCQSHIATGGQSVSFSVEPHLGLMTRYLLLFHSYGLLFVGSPLWREDYVALGAKMLLGTALLVTEQWTTTKSVLLIKPFRLP